MPCRSCLGGQLEQTWAGGGPGACCTKTTLVGQLELECIQSGEIEMQCTSTALGGWLEIVWTGVWGTLSWPWQADLEPWIMFPPVISR